MLSFVGRIRTNMVLPQHLQTFLFISLNSNVDSGDTIVQRGGTLILEGESEAGDLFVVGSWFESEK